MVCASSECHVRVHVCVCVSLLLICFSRTLAVQEAGIVTTTDNRGWSALDYAVASGRSAIVDAVVSVIERAVPPEQVWPLVLG